MSEKPYPPHWCDGLRLTMTVSETDPPEYHAAITRYGDTFTSAAHATPYGAAEDALRKARNAYHWTVTEWVDRMPSGPWHDAAVRAFRYLLPNPSAVYDERLDAMQARVDSLENAVRDLYQTVVKLHVALDRQRGKA